MSTHRRIRRKHLAVALHCSRNWLRERLKDHGLYESSRFSTIPDKDLDILVCHYKHRKPNSGIRYITGFLNLNGIKVQKERIRESLIRIDELGQTLRNHAAIDRREYEVPRPHALWHMDGHHKLIRWGIVIHGIVDGYSRTVSLRFFSIRTALTRIRLEFRLLLWRLAVITWVPLF